MTFIIVGASAGLGRSLSETYAANGYDLVLISSDSRDLMALRNHLISCYGVQISICEIDFLSPTIDFNLIDAELMKYSPLMGILAPIGLVSDSDIVGLNSSLMNDILRINFISPVTLINYFLPAIKANGGNIIGFGSIASARGRQSNIAYASAKAALQTYFEGLRFESYKYNFFVQFYTLGYMDTNLAFSKKLLFPVESTSIISQDVLKNMSVSSFYFLPRFWKPIFYIVRFLPWSLFKRISF